MQNMNVKENDKLILLITYTKMKHNTAFSIGFGKDHR